MKKNLKKDCKVKVFSWTGLIKPVNNQMPVAYHCWGFNSKLGKWSYWYIDEKGKKHKHAPRPTLNPRMDK